MNNLILVRVAAGVVLTQAWSGAAVPPVADERISAVEQEMLLTQFGVQGIDANGDGELSHNEVRVFFPDSRRGIEGRPEDGLMRPPFGAGGSGGPMRRDQELVARFDKDGDARLNSDERQAARRFLRDEARGSRERRGVGSQGRPGPPRWRGEQVHQDPPQPGQRLSPEDVESYPDEPLYEPTVLRTLFLTFENLDWEAELADFYGTDVEVPATLVVDGQNYRDVGVHFRGMSSYMMVPVGYKRSLNLSLDFVDPKQRLYGYKTLNLLNAHEDPSFIRTALYSHVARHYIPAPKANLVKLVINGESWGIYTNVQQFNKEFVTENYDITKGTRWKVRGSPMGGGGLDYVSDTIADYEQRYEMKSDDGDQAWAELMELCHTLSTIPIDELEEALAPILNLEGVLWFLALEMALINNDGYWIRASDYSIFRENTGTFHVVPHDMNEAFDGAMGFGLGGPPGRRAFRGGRFPTDGEVPLAGPSGTADRRDAPPERLRGPGIELDPLVGLDDLRKPLRSRLLAVPRLRARYLENIRTIAETWLDWDHLGPVVEQYRSLVEREIATDTRKFTSYDAFRTAVADTPATDAETPGRHHAMSLRAFADQRRAYLLNHPEISPLR